MTATQAKARKELTGTVTSARMDKTITVVLETLRAHPQYGKRVRARTYVKAHDEKREARTGDTVRVAATRPLSKTKRWRLVAVVHRATDAGEGK